ncbi:MAG: hypothetical protein HGA53_06410, partial [Anaerolineaceae bacterium]|nr:hypothetical protein [Anaerolineaceae bacterium]
MNKTLKIILGVVGSLIVFSAILIVIPRTREAITWRANDLMVSIRSWLNPPESVNVGIGSQKTHDLQATLLAMQPTNTPVNTLAPTRLQNTATPAVTNTPLPTPHPTAFKLEGVKYFTQKGFFNYCAPANLAMAMSYWGWAGKIEDVGNGVKPNPVDKNVMPYELANYARDVVGLGAVERVGGSPELIKRFISAGYPVLVEKGVILTDIHNKKSWMGHYQVVTGFDDNKGVFIAQDSYLRPNLEEPYDVFLKDWRSFNYTYIILYKPEKEAEVMAMLGPDADETANFRNAFALASNEVNGLTGSDQFFAWYNIGTNLVKLQDFGGAADAYDQAYAIYDTLPKELESRPYRILWYQTGPYFAYYYMGRYQDVVNLATNNSINMVLDDQPALEESFYWRGMARHELG